ncbi:MFS monocarboxylate transporter [Heterobasidion irregulare TC 32-1]|uniref:MFS monocarboxylate transporter n=1 Tax=Heterobasidion irregulare (strain TC 32-1) TaxID=747525 RepID=W4JP53_HETIT|nr:MFS monocarboxylate transporter [Heterobasidion irregulare TC 32-1]ETW75337.1 MFS monocarboxylate transporter [Heterobasidion irregulare TC 32-1]
MNAVAPVLSSPAVSEKAPSSQVEERSSTSENTSSPQPVSLDGGLRGWCAVAGAWFIQFCMVGTVTSFGVTQTYYAQHFLTRYTLSDLSWIGTAPLFLEYFFGLSVGQLLDAGHFHWTVFVGTLVFLFSLFMLSLAREGQYYQVFLAQGIGMGAGLGICFLPTSGIVPNHFTRRRALAMGITTTGTSVGGFFFSVLFSHFLNGSIGFKWGIRICAFICLGCLIAANLLMRTHPEGWIAPAQQPSESSSPRKTPPIRALFKNVSYVLTITYGFVVCLGLWFPNFMVQLFAESHGISPGLSSWLLAIINISSIFGRILPNWLADRWGVFEVYMPCTALAGVLAILMLVCTHPASIVVFCILYGFFSGSVVSLYFPAVLCLDPNVGESGVRLGLACMPVGLALLIGTPIASTIVGTHNRWWAGCVFAGVTEIGSAGLLIIAYLNKRKLDARTVALKPDSD